MEKCNKCDYKHIKHSGNRPLFCHRCELGDRFYEVMPDLPGYKLLKIIIVGLTKMIKTIERIIINEEQ